MKPEDMSKFIDILQELCDVYDKEMTPHLPRAYLRNLGRFEMEEIEEAITRYMGMPDKECRFMPKPGDLVKMILGANDDVALIAWTKAMEAMRRYGSYQSVAFDDPIIHRVMTDLGGWEWFGRLPEKEIPFAQKRFCDAYKTYRTHKTDFDYPSHLAGIHEASNRLRGYPVEKPEMFGDPKRVEMVMAKASLGHQTGELIEAKDVLQQITIGMGQAGNQAA